MKWYMENALRKPFQGKVMKFISYFNSSFWFLTACVNKSPNTIHP